MDRPLMQHGVGILEQLFAKSKSDLKVLSQLENELKHRQVPRAVALLEQVRKALKDHDDGASEPSTATVPVPVGPRQGNLLAGQPQEAIVQRAAPKPRNVSEILNIGLATSVAAMSVEEAYKVLKVAPSATWEAIEQSRRQMIQQAHPLKLAKMSVEKRGQVQLESRRINAAYAALSSHRRGSN